MQACICSLDLSTCTVESRVHLDYIISCFACFACCFDFEIQERERDIILSSATSWVVIQAWPNLQRNNQNIGKRKKNTYCREGREGREEKRGAYLVSSIGLRKLSI